MTLRLTGVITWAVLQTVGISTLSFAQASDLVFISLNPCVVFDTRPSFGGEGSLDAEEERSFHVVGSTSDFAGQGGTAGGCGVPAWNGGSPVARAVLINYVAIAPQGAGQLKAWAFDKTEPAQGALVNYQALTPAMNNSNAVVTELSQTAEGLDIKVRARSAPTDVRGVVLGYFSQDHITGVIAGTGLTGGGTEGTVTLALADAGIGVQQLEPLVAPPGIAISAGTTSAGWTPAPPGPTGSTGATGATGNVGQQRTGPERPGFLVSTIASELGFESYSSATIGVDGLGLIAYYDESNGDLKVTHCADVGCTKGTTATVDGAGNVGLNPSITIGTDGLGLIAYFKGAPSGQLKVAHCLDVVCSSATSSILEGGFSAGNASSSITIGSDGLPLVSYYISSVGDLRVAHCADMTCSTATLSTIDAVNIAGQSNSIAIGRDGLGLISYSDFITQDLKVAHCSNLSCTAATVTTLDSTGIVGGDTSLAIGADGLGLIAYNDTTNERLKVAHCSNVVCSSATLTTIAGQVGTAASPSLAIGSDGLGLIAYHDVARSELRVAHCGSVHCATSSVATIDSEGTVGNNPSVTIGSDGFGLISYRDSSAFGLKVAHLSNVMGVPHYRRR